MLRLASLLGMSPLLLACQSETDRAQPSGDVTATNNTSTTEALLGHDETLHFLGTEPFWGGEVNGRSLRYTTPEDIDGAVIPVDRFTGLGGIAFSGLLEGANFEMTVTPLDCSDGMSDRTYPFTVTLQLGDDTRHGCGWTERRRFEGPEAP